MKHFARLALGAAIALSAGGFVGTDGRLYFDFTAGIFPSVSSLWRSGDGGTSWSELTKGTNNIGGTSILMQAQVYAEGSTILFTAGKDIWTSDDDGGSWRTRNEGITPSGTSAITAMAFAGGDLYLLLQAFTPPSATSGVYRRPAAEIGLSGQASSVEVGEHAVAKARLTIAPNPMRDHATITLHLDAPVTARVAVYDMLGDEVALLHDGALEPGEHRMSWEGDGIAAGQYVVRATIDGKVIAGKLTRSR